MANIDTTHIDYARERPDWQKIEHITRLRMLESYLIRLNPHDKSEENEERNQRYRQRAIFYAFAAQTVQGLLGTMFRKDPLLSVPDQLSMCSTMQTAQARRYTSKAKGFAMT